MLDAIALTWRLFAALPAQRYLLLLPWHFTALLIVLGILAAVGLHHLIGTTFRFYAAGETRRPLLGAATLVVLLVSVQGLLLAYVLRTQAEALARPLLAPENAVQPAGVLGSLLLDPAFSDEDLAGKTQVAKDRLAAVIIATDDETYRADLEAFVVKPERLVLAPEPKTPTPAEPPRQPAGERAPAGAADEPPVFTQREDLLSAIVVQMGLRWVLAPGQTWPEAMPAGTSAAADQPVRLPQFALTLMDEIQGNAVLDKLDWEHVAGTRFVQAVLQGVLVERIGRSAGLLALACVTFDVAYFIFAARLVGRLNRRRKAKAT
jgi:hypothetical protein